MKNTEYAIVDIETTGGNASDSRITEIAIIIHDGKNVIDRNFPSKSFGVNLEM